MKRAEIRRDTAKYTGAPMMPTEHGRRLAEDFPDARLVELAAAIREHVAERADGRSRSPA